MAVARLREGLRGAPAGDNTRALVADVARHRSWSARLAVRTAGRIDLVAVADVHWLEADGNYVRVQLGSSEHVMRETLKSLEARLDPAGFARIHRSVIVNVDRISHLEPIEHGEYLVTLRDGRTLYATRSYSRRLRHLLR